MSSVSSVRNKTLNVLSEPHTHTHTHRHAWAVQFGRRGENKWFKNCCSLAMAMVTSHGCHGRYTGHLHQDYASGQSPIQGRSRCSKTSSLNVHRLAFRFPFINSFGRSQSSLSFVRVQCAIEIAPRATEIDGCRLIIQSEHIGKH